MVTTEELDKMTTEAKTRSYARDVKATENSDELRMRGYPARDEEFVYDLLLGGGVLGHPLRPTRVGEICYRMAETLGTTVMFLDFSLPQFGKSLTEDGIYEAFYPFWLASDKAKRLHAKLETASDSG